MTAFSSSSLLRWRTLLFTPRCSPSKTASWRPPWKPNALISGTASGNRSMSCTPTSKCKAEEVPQIFQSNRADLGPVIWKELVQNKRPERELVFYAFQNKMIYPRSAVLLEASSLDFSFKDPTSGKHPYILTPSFLPLTMRKGREIHEQKQPNAVIEDKIIFLFYLSAFFLMRWCR